MANPEHLERLNQGVEGWNNWQGGLPVLNTDLSGADLAGRDLSGVDLRGTDLHQANLRGADLQGVSFTRAYLSKATLREANLQGANLGSVTGGLRTEQLAGADLTGAKLPEDLKTLYDKLENVKGISESARKIFLAVLAGCLYCWLTIVTTTDVNLITNRASSPLPIIQTAIPIVGFYVVAPLLVLCVYFYFHFYLQKLWEELGSLPAVFPDGRPLHAKVDPWLLNDLVRAHLPKLNVNRPFLSHLQLWISVLLAWWVVPVTMLLFWGRYLRRHESIGTAFHVVLLVVALVAAVCLYRLAVATLRGIKRKPLTLSTTLKSLPGYVTVGLAITAGIVFGLVSWGVIRGVRSNKPILGMQLPQSEDLWRDTVGGRWTWAPRAMALIGYSPFANLTGAEVSQKKPNWNPKNCEDEGAVIGAQLIGVDLRYASAKSAFFACTDLSGADLTGAHLTGADLRGVRLTGADLSGAHLQSVRLSSADLTNANLRGAHLNLADLSGALLSLADLTGADLRGTHLNGAELIAADLKDADLFEADLTFSDFWAATNLTPEAVKLARNWDQAIYDDEILRALRLPADHNKKLAAQRQAKEPQQKLNASQPSPGPSPPR
jgi:uncharacterized protein YjbI with pentapeptide repeats